jgi:hypothetical protein
MGLPSKTSQRPTRQTMHSLSITRPRQAKTFGVLCAAVLLASANMLPAQSSSLPATTPTSNTLPAPIAATSTSSTATATKPRRAEVTFDRGLLDVRANDSSLNQILRSISQVTGMKIVGGVAEERVFGNYGPAEPATVLATLLGGTGSNMVLRETASQGPAELILTPRTQGPTPPSPYSSAPQDQDRDDEPAAPARPAGPPQTILPGQAQRPAPPTTPQPSNNVNGSASNTSPTASTLPVTNSVPTDAIPTPSTTPATAGIVDAPNPPPAGSGLPNPTTGATDTSGSNAAGTTTSTSPNGVKTPQQIYEQLQQLIKQGQSQANTQSTPNTQATPSSTKPQ